MFLLNPLVVLRFGVLLILLQASFAGFAQQKVIDSLKHKLESVQSDTVRAALYDELAYTYSNLDPEEGLKYAKLSLELAQSSRWQAGIARSLAVHGINYTRLGAYARAIEYYYRAMDSFAVIDNQEAVAGVWVNIAQLHLKQSNYADALSASFKALTIFEEKGNQAHQAVTLETISHIYFETAQYSVSLEYADKAGELYQTLKSDAGQARVLSHQGRVYNSRKEYQKAEEYHRRAMEIYRRMKDANGIQICLANFGILLTEQKKYWEALPYLEEALTLSEERNDFANIAINQGNLGETYFFIVRDQVYQSETQRAALLGKAVFFLERACSGCRELRMNAPHLEFGGYLALAYEMRKEFENALAVHKEMRSLRDSIFSEDSKLLMARVETKRSLDLKDKDLIIKEKQLEIARLELVNRRNEKAILIGTIFLIGLIFVRVIYHYFIRERRHNKAMETIEGMHSHEVRAPLARIIGLAELLNHEHPEDPVNKELIEGIKASGHELDEKINQIVHTSKQKR